MHRLSRRCASRAPARSSPAPGRAPAGRSRPDGPDCTARAHQRHPASDAFSRPVGPSTRALAASAHSASLLNASANPPLSCEPTSSPRVATAAIDTPVSSTPARSGVRCQRASAQPVHGPTTIRRPPPTAISMTDRRPRHQPQRAARDPPVRPCRSGLAQRCEHFSDSHHRSRQPDPQPPHAAALRPACPCSAAI